MLGDHLGSSAYTVNGTSEVGEIRHLPWGHYRFTSGSTPTRYRFTGQREEASLGLYYYGARWYDPALGRFIQPDTIVPNPRDAGAFDRYAYVFNNPLKYTDPTGHSACAAAMPCPSLPDIQQMMAALKQMGPYAGTAAVAAAGGAMGVAGGVLMVNYALNEEPLGIPPLYPGLSPEVEQGNILITVPIPNSTTLVSGVPLLSDDVSPINGSSPVAPTTAPLVEPLLQESTLTIYTYTSALDRNMQQAGIARPVGSAAHHIVAQTDSRAALSRAILAAAGLTLDAAVNGVYLPANSSVVNVGSAVHSRVHTDAYYREVERRLTFPGLGGVVGELQRISNELLNGTFPY